MEKNKITKIELHDVSLVKEGGISLKDKTVECYCCHKEFKETEGSWISATISGKCDDKTDAEKRFVCNKCNHLKESIK